ncbi:MAG: hypothetical protein KJ725_00370 [Gammaproteobacteria bacterium]|uniref:hypothetical protein n=1 Tax=Methylotuvimicrobium sp. TaxID=2822413 RepID=UPI001D91CD88|nr:hypothetical protein [Gammaproteobacteria bacterium]
MAKLLDAKHYRKNTLRKLYWHRWQIEIDLLFIKKVMQIEPLRCKTPAMARKGLGGLRPDSFAHAASRHTPSCLAVPNQFYRSLVKLD